MKVALTAVAVSIVLSGCTSIFGNRHQPYPTAVMPEASTQDKIQAAQHWHVLAENEAALIAKSLPSASTVAFDPASSKSPFGKAYKHMLTQHLLANGVVVSATPATARYVIAYETQVVRHRDRDSLRAPAGVLSATGASAWLISHAADNWSTPGLVAIPFVVAGDMYLANNADAPTPDTEVLMTTHVRSGDAIVQSTTRIYYFNPGDSDLYTAKQSSSKVLRITDQP